MIMPDSYGTLRPDIAFCAVTMFVQCLSELHSWQVNVNILCIFCVRTVANRAVYKHPSQLAELFGIPGVPYNIGGGKI